MEINLPISKEGYNKAYLKVLNSIVGLSGVELDVVTEMLNKNITVLNTDSRKTLRESLKKDEMYFNTIISTLKKNNTLYKTEEGTLALHPRITDGLKDYSIKINFHTT